MGPVKRNIPFYIVVCVLTLCEQNQNPSSQLPERTNILSFLCMFHIINFLFSLSHCMEPLFSFSCKVVGSSSYKKSLPVKTEDSTGVLVESENVPLSPESFVIPETPESLIKLHNPSGVLNDVTRSPVSRSPSSRGSGVKSNLFTRMPMRSLQNESPKAKDHDNSKSDCTGGGSVKRRMFSPDEPQRAKRVRPMPVKRPSQSPLKDPNSSAVNGLDDYLEEIRCPKSTIPKTKPGPNTKHAPKLHNAGQIMFTNDGKLGRKSLHSRSEEKTLDEDKLSTESSKANSSRSNRSKGFGESTFTVISEPKPIMDHNISRGLSINEELVCSFACNVPEEAMDKMESTVLHPPKGGHFCQVKDRDTDGKATVDDIQEELDDSWFDDKMEPSHTEPKEKPIPKSE